MNGSQVNSNTESFDRLQNSISKTVMSALFGHDNEVEILLKYVRDRFNQQKEYLKDRDMIQHELNQQKQRGEQSKLLELQGVLQERDILQERYENFIKSVETLLDVKTQQKVKVNQDRVQQLQEIKESMEIERARLMSTIFQIQSGEWNQKKRNQPGFLAAQSVLQKRNIINEQKSVQFNRPQFNQQINQSAAPQFQFNEQINQSAAPEYYDPLQVSVDATLIDKNFEAANKIQMEMKYFLQGMDPAIIHAQANGNSIFDTISSDQPLSQEEKKMMNLLSQEAEAKKALERLPPFTQIYLQKNQQVKQITQMRVEMEKVVQEQKYLKIRENYLVTKNDEDDERRKRIRNRLIDSMDAWRFERRYQPQEGFVVHWDWCMNVPKKYDRLRITWGVFLKGQTLFRPKIVEDHQCTSDSYRGNLCMLGEHVFAYDITAHKDVILVLELQCYYIDENNRKQLDIYGWSIHEVFDLNGKLIRGKFKLPLYSPNTNPSQLVASEKPLQSVSNTLVFMRVTFPFDNEQGKDEPLNPSHLTQEYYFTGVHTRSIVRPDNQHVKLPVRKKGYNPLAFDELFNQHNKVIEEVVEDEVQEEDAVEEWRPIELGENRRGIYIGVHAILNYQTKNKCKVRCFLTDIKRGVVKDEKAIPCSFETDVYDQYDGHMKLNQINTADPTLNAPFVFLEEEYQFFIDLGAYAHNNKAFEDLFLIFQTFEQVPDNLIEEDKEGEIVERTYKSVGKRWYSFNLFGNNHMKNGRFAEFIYEPPIKKPPFELLEVRSSNSQIDFSINFFDYNITKIDDQLEKFKMLRMLRRRQRGNQEKKKEIKKLAAEEEEKKVEYDWQKQPQSDRPFIENHKRMYHDRSFLKGFGVDFYIDQARFLPDNTTLCKIVVQFINCNLEKIFNPKSVLPDLKTTVYSPIFNNKQELRSPHYDPTIIALMTILTFDNTNKEIRIVGYSAINLFISKNTKQQPTNPQDTEIYLMDGAYQLPIFCQHPNLIKPFSIDRMHKLDRLPTATLTVRIVLAPMSEDGRQPLSISDVAQKDWEAKGVLQRMPPYSSGYYNTDFYSIGEAEVDLYNVRVKRVDPPQTEVVARLLSYENMTKQMSIAETLIWLDQKLIRESYTEIIELTYFAKYRPEVGFKVSIDGFHRVADTDHLYVAFYSLNPPGKVYVDTGFDAKDIITSTSFNWESPLISPHFNEGYFKLKDVQFNKFAHLIIDVRRIVFSEKGNKSQLEKMGWTILPLFTSNGFVKSGNYQIPVFQGPVLLDMVKEMQKVDAWEMMQERLALRKGGLKILNQMTVIVRLLDGHREVQSFIYIVYKGHFQTAYDFTRMIHTMLPPEQKNDLMYNAGVDAKLKTDKKLDRLAPNKERLHEFNEKITATVFEKLGIQQESQDQPNQEAAQ